MRDLMESDVRTLRRTWRRVVRTALVAVATLALLAMTVVGSVLTPSVPASAADGNQFRAGNIISDAVFYNGSALDASQIQGFLMAKVPRCIGANGQPCLKDYSQATPTLAATSFCRTYSGQPSETAAQIIQRVGAACSINPQVLIVLIEKEQGLVSSPSPTSRMYRSATGYGCPDTADCDTQYYGFFNQVYNAASQFQRYTQTSASRQYQPGRWNNILWHPNSACGSGPVWIENQATANLYIYTPYQPNAAAMANLYGTGDGCSSYGNRNFWRIFTDWFGNPNGGGLMSPSFEGGSISGWGAANGPINQAIYNDPANAKDGSWFLAMNTPVAGRSISQDVQRNVAVGDQATASIWLRSGSSAPFNGVLALWGLSGTNEVATTTFSVGSSWTEVKVKLPFTSSHSWVRIEVYMHSTTGNLWADGAAMTFGQAPPPQNYLRQPSFEGSFAGWVPGNGFMNQQIYQDARAKHGSWFAASNTPVAWRSFAQTVNVNAQPGDRFDFSIWLRSEADGVPVSGQVALWGLGGSALNVGAAAYTVVGGWTKVTATLDVTAAGISQLKAEIYIGDVNTTVWLDDALLAKNLLRASSFENDFTGWATGNGAINQAIYGTSAANPSTHGAWFAAVNTASSGSSLAQSVSRETAIGDNYTAEIWVRSGSSQPYSGTLALWALGGTTEVATQPFVADGTWRLVRVELPIRRMDHSQLKLEVYLGTTTGDLFVDGAQLY